MDLSCLSFRGRPFATPKCARGCAAGRARDCQHHCRFTAALNCAWCCITGSAGDCWHNRKLQQPRVPQLRQPAAEPGAHHPGCCACSRLCVPARVLTSASLRVKPVPSQQWMACPHLGVPWASMLTMAGWPALVCHGLPGVRCHARLRQVYTPRYGSEVRPGGSR